MRIIICHLFLWVITIGTTFAQRTYNIEFNNGEKHTLAIEDDDPVNVPHGNFVFEFFKFGILEGGAYGPFSLGTKYQRIFGKNKTIAEWEACLIPIDIRYLEYSPGEFRILTSWGEYVNKHYFISRERDKRKKLNFISNYNYNVIYRVKLAIRRERKYGIRYGFRMGQNSTTGEYIYFDNATEPFRVTAQRYAYFNLGLSTAKFLNFSYSSPTLGSQRAQQMGECYIDLLISPWVKAYGYSLEPPDYSYINRALSASELKKLAVKYVGFRLGGQLRSSWIRYKNLGSYYHYEIAYYPGLPKNNLAISLGYGVTFFGKRRGFN